MALKRSRQPAKEFTVVDATSQSGVTVLARPDVGVLGQSLGDSFGVVGKPANAGVTAFNSNNDHAAYLASDCCAAWLALIVHDPFEVMLLASAEAEAGCAKNSPDSFSPIIPDYGASPSPFGIYVG
jgi:hypothetical protein